MSEFQFGNSQLPLILGQVSDGTFVRDVSQTFLSDDVDLGSIFRDSADRIFFFGAYPGPLGGPTGEVGQLATNNFVAADCFNLFFDGASDNKTGYNQTVDVTQYIGFTDRHFADPAADIIFSPFETSPPNNRVGIVFTHNVTDTLDWNDHDGTSGILPLYDALKRVYPAENSLGFTDVITNAPLVDGLFQQVFVDPQTLDTVGTDFGGPATQTFLQQHVAFRIQGVTCPEKEYTPFVGASGDDSYPEVSTTAPTLGSGVLTLTHPRISPTLTLTLKNPEFGNADVLRFTKVDRRTRGGDRKLFSDLGWGSTQSFELTITNVCESTATIDEIIDFLNTSLGDEIGLLDWENRQWKGIIVAPETEVIPQVGGHTVRIVFEGELV